MTSPVASPSKVRASAVASSLCPRCNKDLESGTDQGVVVSFGSSLFHLDCFRCAKCNTLVEGESNLLLLSDGSPVCENCSYNCTFCHQPIITEAIVTGEESYHAECFKCRSCDNRIEELVFAKTSQGIYCMSCHNERVSRSRKHAEAKRNKSLRQRSERSGSSAARSPHLAGHSPHLAQSLDRQASSSTQSSHSAAQPAADSQSSSVYSTQPSSAAQSRSPMLLQQQQRPSARNMSASDPARPASKASTPELKGLGFPVSPQPDGLLPPQDASSLPAPRNSFAPHDALPAAARSRTTSKVLRSPSPLLGHIDERGSKNAPSPQSTNEDTFAPSGLQGSRRFDSLPHLDRMAAGVFQSNTAAANKRNSLAPVKPDRSANRRSGFYGLPARPTPPVAEEGSNGAEQRQEVEDAATTASAPPTPTKDRVGPLHSRNETAPSASLAAAQKAADLPPPATAEALNRSMSYYDPDMLLDLQASPEVSRLPKMPQTNSNVSMPVDIDVDEGTEPSSAGGNMETLAFRDDESEYEDEPELPNGLRVEEEHGGVARRVKESLRASNDGSAFDVSLVEKLLAELDETKDKIKELQKDNNAMKRASSQFIAGMNNVRDSYEREAELRRQSHLDMAQLRTRLHEQAQKLVSMQAAQKEDYDLARRSKELRTSVFGMEKELSTLKAERDLAMAEMHGLKRLSKDGVDFSSASVALTEHLEGIKSEHRAALEELSIQREQIQREISELSRKRDNIKEENALYESHGRDLIKANADLTKQLEVSRQSLEQLQRNGMRGFPKLSASSTHSVSSYDTIPEAAGLTQAHRVEHSHPQAVRKFKWGKGKPAAEIKASISHPTHKAGQSSVTSARGTVSTDVQFRQHMFQPTSILRPVRCEHCSEKMWGLQELRCVSCGLYCHSRCQPHYPIQCNYAPMPTSDDNTAISGGMFGNDLSRQAASEGKSVPHVVTACIAAVESFGMDFEGIYRKTGGMSQVKQITHLFETNDSVDLENGNWDIAAVTSVLKNYFRALENPLFTHELHDDFVAAAEHPSADAAKLDAIAAVVQQLPEVHHAVLAKLMQHLYRVQEQKEENKMTPANLGVVFSPTLLRSSIAGKEFEDINFRARVVELCVEHAPRLFP